MILYFSQPWRKCDYEDTSAGCVMLPHGATVMLVAMIAFVASMAVLAAGLVTHRTPSPGE